MTSEAVVVIGAGPAGMAAAIAATEFGPVVLLDERTGTTDVPAGVDSRPGTSVWGLFPERVVAVFDDARPYEIAASAVIVATGGVDRVWPMPGWHLDGVLTTSVVIESGLRYGVIGDGRHTASASSAIEAAGGTVMAVEDGASARIEGGSAVERLGDIPVDRVVLALGRHPDPSLVLQARAACAFDRDALIAMPLLSDDGATSLPGVFVAGEAAGVVGEDAVRAHGAVVGRAAAAVARGESQSTDLNLPPLPAFPPLPLPDNPATIICREQGVDLGIVRTAIDAGVHDANDLRRRTRAGMGLRGAREAMPVLATLLLAANPAIPDERLIPRQRPPVRPLPFRTVLQAEVAS